MEKNTSEKDKIQNSTTYESSSDSSQSFKQIDLDSNNADFVLRVNIDKTINRYPFCIVWTPLPLISWIIPIIGHTGICR
jgi:hypothetical protein